MYIPVAIGRALADAKIRDQRRARCAAAPALCVAPAVTRDPARQPRVHPRPAAPRTSTPPRTART
jgi:hypothetical protein